MDEENTLLLERATGLIKCCKLPRLTRNIDEAQLKPETFRDFLAILDETLPQLFDLMAQYESELLGFDEFNRGNLEFQVNLALMVAEQVYVPGELYEYQTENVTYRARLSDMYQNGLLERILTGKGSERTLKLMWEHYQKVLKGKEWMYHPGDVVGFVRICEFLYVKNESELTQTLASFVLSVGISLVEFHDPEYETIGLRLFNVLLNDRHRSLIKKSNIHEVVFQNAFRLSAKAKNERFLRELWSCLYRFVEMSFQDQTDFSEWSKLDDIVEALLEALAFESNLILSSVLMVHLLKILSLDLTNFVIDDLDDIKAVDTKSCHVTVLEQLREGALLFHNRRFYRWHKRLVAMIPFEFEKACGAGRECSKYMHGVHLLFVLTVFPMELQAIEFVPSIQSSLLDFMILFKRHMRDQCNRLESLTSETDSINSMKASESFDRTVAVFCRSVAQNYFPKDRTNFWSVLEAEVDRSREIINQEDRCS
ncbi:uncharacterized protein LOC134202871 isoform X2 [Armigeres subalbatus]